MSNRPDETWHRLREWTYGQAPSERMSAQILTSEGYVSLDPSHPLGGPDGGKDALCQKDDRKWVMAVYFPRGQQAAGAIKKKFLDDLLGVAANDADALAFVTNQELTLGERSALKEAAGSVPVELYHLERLATILDQPAMAPVRRRFLGIETGDAERLAELQLAEAEARLKIFPKLIPAGFSWSGGNGVLRFQVHNETQSLFRVVEGSCRWRLDHDSLYAWTIANHLRLLHDPEAYVQQIRLDPTVVRLDAPLTFSLTISSRELHEHFGRASRAAIEGVIAGGLPATDLALGEVELRCEAIVGSREEIMRFAFRWGT